MEQALGRIRDGEEVLYDGLVYLASFEIAAGVSWCGLVLAPTGAFRPERPVLTLELTDGRSARIAVAASPTSSGRLHTVHFDVLGVWGRSAG